MMKQAFMAAIIVTTMFGCKNEPTAVNEQHAAVNKPKPEEKTLPPGPEALEQFIKNAAIGVKQLVVVFPPKGKYETSAEYNKRVVELKKETGAEDSILYKATGLFPVRLGQYNADTEEFRSISLHCHLPQDSQQKLWRKPEVAISYGSRIPGTRAFAAFNIKCPRDMARIFGEKQGTLRCDVVFTLNYTKGAPGGVPVHMNWNLFEDYLTVWVQKLKFYSLETGEILFQASSATLKTP